jgi:DNA-binding protein H-NS
MRKFQVAYNDAVRMRQDQERDAFVATMREKAEQLGFDLGSMFGVAPPQRRARANNDAGERATPKAKYRDTNGNQWTGRGRMAGWLAQHVEDGLAKGVSKEKTLEKYLIKE